MEQVKIRLSGGIMPKRATMYAAAYDLYCPVDYELRRGRQVIDLRFSMELPHGTAAIIQPRSGFAARGMSVLLFVRRAWMMLFGIKGREERIDVDVEIGLIDEDYRGHVGVIVKNNYRGLFHRAVIPAGTRIAQMRIVSVPDTEVTKVEELDMSNDRGGGFGHTGKK